MTRTQLSRLFPGKLDISITIITFGVCLISLLWGIVAIKVRAEEKAEIRDVMKHTANLARAVEEHAVRTIREADQVLLFLQHQYSMQGTTPDLRHLIEDGPILSRIYTYLSVIDEHGNLAAGSQPFKPVNLSDREHFQVHVARDILNQPFVSKPVVGRASGKASIQITRRINKPDLAFGGVAVVSIDPDYLSQFYRQLDIGEKGMATLVGRDGIVRAQRAGSSNTGAPDAKQWALFKHLETSERGSYATTSAKDGLTRIFSYRALQDYPLVVTVGVAETEALADFYQRRRNYYEAAALASILILAFTGLLVALVSRRKRAEAERAQLAEIVENSNDAIISRTLEGTITSWNTAAERMFGYSAREAIGKPLALIKADDRAGDRQHTNTEMLLRHETVKPFEARRRRKDGRIVEVSCGLSPVRDKTGNLTGIAVINRDISELKKAEIERTQLAAIVENSNDAIITRSLDGRFMLWNKGAERMFGYTAAEAIGQPITLILPPEERGEVAKKLERTRRGETPAPYETRRLTKDGRIIDVASSISPIRDGSGATSSVSIIFHDISARKKAEAMHARLAAIVESTTDAIISRGLDGTIQSWNSGAERMFGWTAPEAIGRKIAIIIPPERRGDLQPLIERVMDGEALGAVESTHCRKDGSRIETSVTFSAIRDRNDIVTAISLIYRDITERKQAQAQIAYLSQYDTLTSLPNRGLFQDRLELAVAHARRRNETLGVLLVDLDRFKKVNESLGHEAGDELLRKVASRLKSSLREVDTIARLGGNDFAVLVEGIRATDDVTAVADKLIQALVSPFEAAGQEIFVSASVGIAVCSNGNCVAGRLLEGAEIAMSRAKQDGGGGRHLFQDEPITPSGKRLTFETRLRHALENGEFAVHYQPKVSLLTGDITGAEALLRWNSPELGQVSPAEFIPIAEETGLIVPIGAWILEAACTQTARWRSEGHDLNIAVNLSPRQFHQKELVSMVAGILVRSGLKAQQLELEITEGTAMKNAEQTVAVLNDLHRLGVQLAVDDFGTGYSSLGYLKRFPLHCLKIDRSFVSDAVEDPNSQAIVRATLALAHSLNLKVVAEGVETAAQRNFLAGAGCDEYQGYFFSRPLPAAEFRALLVRAQP